MLLPQPDSPTTPSVSPAAISTEAYVLAANSVEASFGSAAQKTGWRAALDAEFAAAG